MQPQLLEAAAGLDEGGQAWERAYTLNKCDAIGGVGGFENPPPTPISYQNHRVRELAWISQTDQFHWFADLLN